MSKDLISDLPKFKDVVNQELYKEVSSLPPQCTYDNYLKWVKAIYTKQLPKLELKTKYEDGMLKRVFNISSMLYMVLPNMLYGNTVVFKLFDMNTNKEINYAILFCENITELPDQLKKNIAQEQQIGNIVMQNYSISPSFISCDGEYRSTFTRYKNFIDIKRKYPELWNDIEMYVIKSIRRRQWNIYTSYFHGREVPNNIELERVIKSNLMAQSFLANAWFNAIYNEYLGLTESHMNETFREIMFSNLKIDIEFIKELIKKYGEDELKYLKKVTTTFMNKKLLKPTERIISVGYKIIPLNLREVQYPLKLQYKPWREFLIANKCNDLIINQIAPGFPVTLDWFLIKKSHKGLFDNKSQYERLKNSELARSILSSLYDAQKNTYFSASNLGNKSSTDLKEWISNKFKVLHEKIREPIDYSIEEIIMSDITLAFPSEFVGKTIADTVQLIKKSKKYNQMIGKPFHDYEFFKKFMFEICYNLLVFNKRINAVHGDFHLNNATIGRLYLNTNPNAKVVYQIDDDHKYTFTNNGYFACIIDFSRSLINVEEYESLKDESMNDSFKLIDDYDKFETNEISRLLSWYLQLYPNKAKQKEELHITFKNNTLAVFKLLTAMDIYMFTARLNVLLSKQNNGINKRCFDLLEKINRLSEIYITTDMNNLMKTPDLGQKISEGEYPIETIIKKCFSDCMLNTANTDNAVITDYYILNNPMAKSISKYDLFPDAIKYSKYYNSKDEIIDIPFSSKMKRATRDIYEKRKKHNLEHLKFLSHTYLDAEL